jgi:hypothetical protein
VDLRPPFSTVQSAFGQLGEVTVPGGDPVETVVAWLPPTTSEYPTTAPGHRAEPHRLLAFSYVDVPQVPRGTLIRTAEFTDGPMRTWRVDEAQRVDFDHYRAVVLPVEDVT